MIIIIINKIQISMCQCVGRRWWLAKHTLSLSGRVEEKSASFFSSDVLTHTCRQVRTCLSMCVCTSLPALFLSLESLLSHFSPSHSSLLSPLLLPSSPLLPSSLLPSLLLITVPIQGIHHRASPLHGEPQRTLRKHSHLPSMIWTPRQITLCHPTHPVKNILYLFRFYFFYFLHI